MSYQTFRELFEHAEKTDEYWIERSILELTEGVVRRMEELGVSRAELARRLGTSPAYVTKILRGNANFTLATIARLARALEAEPRLSFAPLESASDSSASRARVEPDSLPVRRRRGESGTRQIAKALAVPAAGATAVPKGPRRKASEGRSAEEPVAS